MHEDTAARPPAPPWLRGAAFAIDAVLALVTVFAVGLLLPGSRPTLWQPQAPLFGPRDVAAVLALLLVRDVVLPASPAKWLLCLRLERPSGAPLPFAARLRRAPLSLLPLAFLPRVLQWRCGWQVRTYAPSRFGLALRTSFALCAAVLSITWSVTTLRPSIAADEAELLAAHLLRQDVQLQETLGRPVRVDIRSVARRGEQDQSGTARFWLRLRGTHARQDMQVHVRRIDGVWAIEELSDIEVTPTGDTADLAEG